MTHTKRCWKCGKSKNSGEFHLDSSRNDALSARCAPCSAILRLSWYKQNKKEHIEKVNSIRKRLRKYSLKTRIGTLFQVARARIAGKRNTKMYLGMPICPRAEFYGTLLSLSKLRKQFDKYVKSGWKTEESPTIKLKKVSKGFVPGNMLIVAAHEVMGSKGRKNRRMI